MILNSREKIILTYASSFFLSIPGVIVCVLYCFVFPSFSKIHKGLKCRIM